MIHARGGIAKEVLSMEDGILVSIKKMLGLHEEDVSFDTDIIIHINSVLMILGQLGVVDTSFFITGNTETWSECLDNRTDFNSVKSYIYMKVKLIFDPPLSNAVMEAHKLLISELEWRLNVASEMKEVM